MTTRPGAAEGRPCWKEWRWRDPWSWLAAGIGATGAIWFPEFAIGLALAWCMRDLIDDVQRRRSGARKGGT